MDDKYVRRGEIWSVMSGDTVGGEQAFTRPGLIISSQIGNDTSPTVIVAYLTTKDHNIGIQYGPTKATGRPSYIQCNQIATVSKQRLCRCMGQLSENEMREVESLLDEVLDLGYVDDTPLKEKEKEISALKLQMEELRAENANLKKKVAGHEDELISRDVEIAVHKRMYEKAIGIIATMRAESDMPKPVVKEEPPVAEVPPKTAESPVVEEPKLPDINTCKFSVLRGIGFSNNIALNVMNGRPYKNIEDLKKVSGMTKATYNIVKDKICCIPVEKEEEPPKQAESAKVNINRCSISDLTAVGITAWHAGRIIKHRDAHGDFEKVEDVTNIDKITPKWLSMFGDKLEV